VRLLNKAHALNPGDEEIGSALREAEREMAAVRREMAAERRASQEDAAASRREGSWGGDSASNGGGGGGGGGGGRQGNADQGDGGRRARGAAHPNGGGAEAASARGGPSEAPRAYAPPPDDEPRSRSGPSWRAGATSTADDAARGAADAQPPRSRAGRLAHGALLLLLRLLTMVAAAAVWLYHASGCSRLVAWVANSGEWVEAKWLKMLGDDFELAERIAYLGYYWRARLRWPFRLLGVLFGLLLAWWYPWHAYALIVLGVSGLGVWLTPHMAWGAFLSQPTATGLAVALCFFCWALPRTSGWMVGCGSPSPNPRTPKLHAKSCSLGPNQPESKPAHP